jgi:hypothetical protein
VVGIGCTTFAAMAWLADRTKDEQDMALHRALCRLPGAVVGRPTSYHTCILPEPTRKTISMIIGSASQCRRGADRLYDLTLDTRT